MFLRFLASLAKTLHELWKRKHKQGTLNIQKQIQMKQGRTQENINITEIKLKPMKYNRIKYWYVVCTIEQNRHMYKIVRITKDIGLSTPER